MSNKQAASNDKLACSMEMKFMCSGNSYDDTNESSEQDCLLGLEEKPCVNHGSMNHQGTRSEKDPSNQGSLNRQDKQLVKDTSYPSLPALNSLQVPALNYMNCQYQNLDTVHTPQEDIRQSQQQKPSFSDIPELDEVEYEEKPLVNKDNNINHSPNTFHKDTFAAQLKQMEMNKQELFAKYRLHVFVFLIFLIIAVSISLSLHFKNKTLINLKANQAISFDPSTRTLTLSDVNKQNKVSLTLGKEIPSWLLPRHCPAIDKHNPTVKSCIWKNLAQLTIRHFSTPEVNCYNVSWETFAPQVYPHDCLQLGDDVWYGPSNQTAVTFPVQGTFVFQPSAYTTMNNGVFSARSDMFWLSAQGSGLYVIQDSPVQVFWNVSGSGELCLVSNSSDLRYYQQYTPTVLNYTVCQSDDIIKTHWSMLESQLSLNVSEEDIYSTPYWSMRGYTKSSNFTDEDVHNLTSASEFHDFTADKIALDGTWQKTTGDLTFDPKFNVSRLLELSQEKLKQVVLTLAPFYDFESQNFAQGISNSCFVKDPSGLVPGLTLQDGELTAVLDVFNSPCVTWFTTYLKNLKSLGVTHFRLTDGSGTWLPYMPRFQWNLGTPCLYRKLLAETLSDVTHTLIIDHSLDSRHVTSYVPLVADVDVVEGRNCIVGAIEHALTLSLMGYPLVLLDGYQEKNGAKMTSELYVRWYHLALTFPAYQILDPPWKFGDYAMNLTRTLQKERDDIMAKYRSDLLRDLLSSQPLLRPVWWISSSNVSAHKVKIQDEFLLGSQYLVAPVLCEGVYQRDIYIPSGLWQYKNINYMGPKILTNISIEDHKLAIFTRQNIAV